MRLNTPAEPPAPLWEDGLLDTKLEAQLTQSIQDARAAHLPRDLAAPQPNIRAIAGLPYTQEQPQLTTHAQLIAGCGIAAIDGYLAARDYAASKGLDLIEMKHKGIDFQDLISTLVIHTQKMAEMESRQPAAARYKR